MLAKIKTRTTDAETRAPTWTAADELREPDLPGTTARPTPVSRRYFVLIVVTFWRPNSGPRGVGRFGDSAAENCPCDSIDHIPPFVTSARPDNVHHNQHLPDERE